MIKGYFGTDDVDDFYSTITLKEFYENLDMDAVERFLNSLGVQVERHSNFLICPTICHNILEEAESMKLYYYAENKKFHCYTECGENFSIFELYKRYMALNHGPVSDEEAEDYIKRFVNYGESRIYSNRKKTNLFDLDSYKVSPDIMKCESYPNEVLDLFIQYYHDSWLKEGITPDVMQHFNIKFSLSQNKIVIPHYDFDGDLVGIRARSLSEEDLSIGKYMPIKVGNIIYSHQLGFNLYGIFEHKKAIEKYRKVTLYEAEKSVMLDEVAYGKDSVAVASCGSSFNKFQLNLLIKKLGVSEITIAFDKEFTDPYDEKGKKYREKLIKIGNKYKNYCNFYYIFDEQNLLKEKDSPIDRGVQIYEQLYKKRYEIR